MKKTKRGVKMNKQELFELFKALIVRSHLNDDPTLSKARLEEIGLDVNDRVQLDTPLAAIGLDSMKMIWLTVKFEEALDINASGLSFFEIFDVNDLLEEILKISADQIQLNA
jgi:acyl carrier protein